MVCSLSCRRLSSSSGHHHRVGEPAQLPSHSVELALVCTHRPVHPQMESGEFRDEKCVFHVKLSSISSKTV